MRASISLELITAGAVALATSAAGCDRNAATTAPSDGGTAPGAHGSNDEHAPEGIKHTYVGRDDDADESDDADDENDDEESTASSDDTLTGEAAKALVDAALDEVLEPHAARVVTPALPPSWPLEGSKVVYFVYPLTPAERGVDRYKTSAPSHRVELDVVAREASVEIVEKPKKMGDYERPRPKRNDPIIKAEQALLDVAAGRQPAEKVHYLLFGYEQWFEANGTVGADARKRVSEFARWASSWGR